MRPNVRKGIAYITAVICAGLLLASCAPESADTAVVELTPLPSEPAPTGAASPSSAPTPAPTLAPTPSASPSPEPTYPMKTFKYKPEGYVIGHSVNLREGPGTEYETTRKLAGNTTVNLIAESGEWYYVTVNGEEGFVNKEFIVIGSTETSAPKYSDEEVYMAAQMIYLEAKGGTYEEYLAIANVLVNRIESRRFPNSVEKNIFSPGQFSVADDRDWFLSRKPDRASRRAAQSVLNDGKRVLDEGVMYFRSKRLDESWGRRIFYKTIGNHCFFK